MPWDEEGTDCTSRSPPAATHMKTSSTTSTASNGHMEIQTVPTMQWKMLIRPTSITGRKSHG
jgi:hypothetical protein